MNEEGTRVIIANDEATSNTAAYTVQDSSPVACRPPIGGRAIFMFPFIVMIIWLTIFAFFIVMAWKFVKAHERIATKLEDGITIKKDNISL